MKAGPMYFSSASSFFLASWGKNTGLNVTWVYPPASRVEHLVSFGITMAEIQPVSRCFQ